MSESQQSFLLYQSLQETPSWTCIVAGETETLGLMVNLKEETPPP